MYTGMIFKANKITKSDAPDKTVIGSVKHLRWKQIMDNSLSVMTRKIVGFILTWECFVKDSYINNLRANITELLTMLVYTG